MHGIKYRFKMFNKQVWQVPITNTAYFQVRENALKNAQESFEEWEYQKSIKRSKEKLKELQEEERKKDDFKLASAKIKVTPWLNCLNNKKLLKLFHISVNKKQLEN